MGGCRCTYRSCMVKSDGKTHMFHYPVFDKVRCHQWLINARRMEYLNLKVSQLKNRVVCQHHFKDQYFMNFKKEKLTFDAVPTEDGPYCDLTKWVDKSHEYNKLYPIVIEDIENDHPINDKKANFSLKYIDFLTNSENIETSYQKNDINIFSQTKSNNLTPYTFIISSNIEKPQIIDETELINDKVEYKSEHNFKKEDQPTLIVPPESEQLNLSEKALKKEFIEIDILPEQKLQTRPRPKVRIISERKITSPVPLFGIGNFQPISPSVILNVSSLKQNNWPRTDDTLDIKPLEDEKDVLQLLNVQDMTEKTEEPQYDVNVQPQEGNETVNKKIFGDKETMISNLKNKLSPERVAAIREKREFNMKLKDIIESCVIKGEEPEKVDAPSLQLSDENKIVKASNSCEDDYFNNNEIFLANLEARMTRMENLLLNKIDQNTQRFMDLKKSIVTTTQKKRSISTQTITSEEAHKRYLYSEISKYLGPESNNLIYQELFINKFGVKVNNQSLPGKRRKIS